VTASDDARYMGLALSLGARGLGHVWPNPAVGCVVVRDGRIAGRGWTLSGGRPHAEAQALRQAGTTARGATVYVSLEPCAHEGQTAPCADALINAGVARVVTPISDPDPRVFGQGHARLEAAGITVSTGVLADPACKLHRGFLSRVTKGRPMVTLKLATSFDGRIATASGESQWITGEAARARVHQLRHSHDAVLVGGGTARADDPSLTVRGFGPVRQPVRIVAARRLDLPENGQLGDPKGKGPLWLIHGDKDVPEARIEPWQARGADLIPCPVMPGSRLDVPAMLAALGARGLTRVLCEGGGSLAAALLLAGCVDEIIGFTAGIAVGAEGRPALGGMGLGQLSEAPRFQLMSSESVGGDVMHRWMRADMTTAA